VPRNTGVLNRISFRCRRCCRCGAGTLAATRARPMIDYQAQLEKLRRDAAECALIADLATSPQKRELFARLAEHLGALAADVKRAMTAANENASGTSGDPGP
jgi:hypothetical protein